ncbi:hypothetical protein V1507DRAFT_395768, partial [Lipomyces tetrasporus]
IIKTTNKRRLTDRVIRYSTEDAKGSQCSWTTAGSRLPDTTSNIKNHFASTLFIFQAMRIGIWERSVKSACGNRRRPNTPTIAGMEKNILRWIVTEKQAFTTIESATFRQIFHVYREVALPFSSRRTLRKRLIDEVDSH